MASEIDTLIEFHLDEIDAWRSGAKATVGQPYDGANYALSMRCEVRKHAEALIELGYGPVKKIVAERGFDSV